MYCSCPDFAEHGHECKHIYAVRFQVTNTETHADGSETVTTMTVERKATYKQDWPTYNAAQVNEHRHFQTFLADICGTLRPDPEKQGKRGRPAVLPADAAFCAVYKVYSTMSARRFMGDLDEARDGGFVTRVPHFNSVLNFFDNESSTGILHDFVAKSAAPLVEVESAFATDSTGFAGARYHKWFDEKYGRPKQEVEWVKLHATVGVRTNVVTACKVTDKTGADATQFPELARKTAEQFDIKEMSVDKAYASKKNCDVMEQIGGQFYSALKKNATGKAGGSYERVFHLMCLNREDYMTHYHKRSNVESTFSAIKRKFGESLRSKTPRAMANECLAKVVCHNLTCVINAVYELGIDPAFVLQTSCTNNGAVAHLIAPE